MAFKYDPKFIRNFSIIAHIDHGKSTISDRLLEITGTVPKREMHEQLLDNMELEKERGITIKARPVTMYYKASDGRTYQYNFIDTPGHVDFSYEVSRSLAACEGALLIVDAVQGVQAQTIANVHRAIDRNLEIIPIINKIDLPAAQPEQVIDQIEEVIGLDRSNVLLCSAKTGEGIESILEHILFFVPPPQDQNAFPLRALVFDSHYDPYRGVMIYVRVMSGKIDKGLQIKLMATQSVFEVVGVGVFSPDERPCQVLQMGEVGYVVANIKNSSDVKVGDTLTTLHAGSGMALPGFRLIKPVVYAGIYPIDSSDFANLRDALEKLQLNDPALHIEQESSVALGFGCRCGFLGLLHLEIIFERLRREFDLDIIITSPGVIYNVVLSSGEQRQIDNPAQYPDPATIKYVEEPWVVSHIMTPKEYLGTIMSLSTEKRGVFEKTESVGEKRLLLTFRFPMSEVFTDFNNRLKSITRGYGSFDYEFDKYEVTSIAKLEILLNHEVVDPFSCLVHTSKAEAKGRAICQKLKEIVPHQQFKVPIQAAIGGKIIARETLSALAKNVSAKCYGGDITRKRKLWEKQKKGKRRMKEFGRVTLPHSVFMEVLKVK